MALTLIHSKCNDLKKACETLNQRENQYKNVTSQFSSTQSSLHRPVLKKLDCHVINDHLFEVRRQKQLRSILSSCVI